jgi:hypothetical protein
VRRALTSQHDWYIGTAHRATINPPPSVFPRIEINHEKGVAGWFSLPDVDADAPSTPTGLIGERPHARLSRGKTLTYNLQLKEDYGSVYPDVGEDLLPFSAAFVDRSSVGLLIVTPWEGLESGPLDDVEIWATFARILEFDADDLQSYGPDRQPSPFIRDSILSLRQIDGRWLWWNESGTEGDPMVFTDGDDAVEVTNSGTAPTEPVIQVAGVMADDDIHIGRDAATGADGIAYPLQSLWFRGLPAGTLTVDFSKRQLGLGPLATVDGTDVTDHLDVPNSDWWDPGIPGIPPGTFNVWRGPGAGGALTCSFFSADW